MVIGCAAGPSRTGAAPAILAIDGAGLIGRGLKRDWTDNVRRSSEPDRCKCYATRRDTDESSDVSALHRSSFALRSGRVRHSLTRKGGGAHGYPPRSLRPETTRRV